MADVRAVHVVSMRPVPIEAGGNAGVGIEIVAANGDHFVVTMSGEGMTSLVAAMQSFLSEHPQLAKTKSQSRQ